ncbi:MAG: FTR1 family protein [Rickettsiales bacterium]|jgi:high-affinity iron transporter|nr:FTR1 family protein [Rickettsiales bacterium]
MLATAVIVFREMLEICLILGIISAALDSLKNKKTLLLAGITGGIILSIIFAFTMTYINGLFDGNGQEILKIIILTISIIFINLTIIWITKHRKELHNKINNATQRLINKEINTLSLVIVIIFVISREGMEIILFLSGIYSAGSTPQDLILGSIIGTASGITFGLLLYNGLLKIHVKNFFSVINIMLILLAAGMASELANYLNSADLIEVLSKQIWDSSWLINENSITGKILHSLLGYSSKPTQLQVIFYGTSIAITSILLINSKKLSK